MTQEQATTKGKQTRPDCYKCVYRKNLAGNAHSKCTHPTAEAVKKTLGPMGGLLEFMPGPVVTNDMVEGDPRGMLKGWFSWPFNFDPTWLVRCNGFKGKGTE